MCDKERSPPEVFLGKSVLKICSKFTREHACRSVISIKLQSNFIEITLRHGCSPVSLLHIFGAPFPKNTSGGLLLTLRPLILSLGFKLVIRSVIITFLAEKRKFHTGHCQKISKITNKYF